MDPESVNQIVKAITSLHDGRTWKPETVAAVIAAVAATAAATVTFILGRRQISAAREVAKLQIEAAQTAAQRQIDSAQAVAKQQVESAQTVAQRQVESAQEIARQQLIMPMREAWIGKLREKLGALIGAYVDGNLSRYPFLPADVQRLTAIQTEIGLMLNPEDPDQAALDAAIQSLFSSFTTKSNDGAFREAVRRAAACSRIVLRSEWQRAKAGE